MRFYLIYMWVLSTGNINMCLQVIFQAHTENICIIHSISNISVDIWYLPANFEVTNFQFLYSISILFCFTNFEFFGKTDLYSRFCITVIQVVLQYLKFQCLLKCYILFIETAQLRSRDRTTHGRTGRLRAQSGADEQRTSTHPTTAASHTS